VAGVESVRAARVRRMERKDVAAVAAIEAGAFSSPWSRETFSSLLDRPGLAMLVLDDASEGVIGYAVLWCISDQGELANVAVVPHLQGRGLGSRLLAGALDIARERGITSVYLEVRASNERAAQLYRRFGFSEVGRRKRYYERPTEDALIMMVRL
jgi:ribosomal-protein-alanine N-acetyltransferase